MSALKTHLRAHGFCSVCDCITSYGTCWYCGNPDLDFTYSRRFPFNPHPGLRLVDMVGEAS